MCSLTRCCSTNSRRSDDAPKAECTLGRPLAMISARSRLASLLSRSPCSRQGRSCRPAAVEARVPTGLDRAAARISQLNQKQKHPTCFRRFGLLSSTGLAGSCCCCCCSCCSCAGACTLGSRIGITRQCIIITPCSEQHGSGQSRRSWRVGGYRLLLSRLHDARQMNSRQQAPALARPRFHM